MHQRPESMLATSSFWKQKRRMLVRVLSDDKIMIQLHHPFWRVTK